MTRIAGALDRLGLFLIRTLGRATTIAVGCVMTIAGFGMSATIVLLPLGVMTGLLGVAIFLCGTSAPDPKIDR